jgi:D-serine deaminase-like pyridoxal phosphate-dependent protein
MKVLTTDNGLPDVLPPQGVRLLGLNEEHGILEVDPEKVRLEVGMVIELVPNNGCTTVNLHDRYYVIQDGLLMVIWEINGRGKSQ